MVDVRQRLRQTMLAFMACNNPNVPYSLARYRECKEEEDRVYGVMQVYGFRLGKTVQPHLNFSLDELSVQFVKTLNEQYPVIAQMFVHTAVPERGRSWKITPDCDIPEDLSVYDPRPADNTTSPRITPEALTRGDARASFHGLDVHYDRGFNVSRFRGPDQEIIPDAACEIKTVIDENLNANLTGYGWPIAEMEETLQRSRCHLYLDATNYSWINDSQGLKYDGHVVFQGLRRDDGYTQRILSSQLKMIARMVETIDADAYLVYLGHVQGGSSLATWPLYLGLIAFRPRSSENCERLGVCTWRGHCLLWPPWRRIEARLL